MRPGGVLLFEEVPRHALNPVGVPARSSVTARSDPCRGASPPAHATRTHTFDERRPCDSADTATGAQAAVVRRHNEYLWVSWVVDSIPGVFKVRRPMVVS